MFLIETQETNVETLESETIESVVETVTESEVESIDTLLDSETPESTVDAETLVPGLTGIEQQEFYNGSLLFMCFALALILGLLLERVVFRRLN